MLFQLHVSFVPRGVGPPYCSGGHGGGAAGHRGRSLVLGHQTLVRHSPGGGHAAGSARRARRPRRARWRAAGHRQCFPGAEGGFPGAGAGRGQCHALQHGDGGAAGGRAAAACALPGGRPGEGRRPAGRAGCPGAGGQPGRGPGHPGTEPGRTEERAGRSGPLPAAVQAGFGGPPAARHPAGAGAAAAGTLCGRPGQGGQCSRTAGLYEDPRAGERPAGSHQDQRGRHDRPQYHRRAGEHRAGRSDFRGVRRARGAAAVAARRDGAAGHVRGPGSAGVGPHRIPPAGHRPADHAGQPDRHHHGCAAGEGALRQPG